MVCKNTSTSGAAGQAGFTLVEIMVAIGLGSLVSVVLLGVFFYASRSFVALSNYMELDLYSQQAIDRMSKEIRQARQLTAFSTNSLTMLDVNGNSLAFVYDPNAATLNRVSGGVTNTYLTGCDSLQFSTYQHTPMSNTFDCYDPAYATNTKLIQVTWICSRQIFGSKVNTESVQSAKIAVRNN